MGQRKDAATQGRLLITGADGLLGREIVRSFSPSYEILATDRGECDVTSGAECMRIVREFRPDVVVHCAAYTAVDRAETEEQVAFAVNARGTRNVALACRAHRTLLVGYSTDYVFDGASRRPYAEDDPTGPLSAYGRSKLGGEEALREVNPEFLLIRTQWLFGGHGPSFVSAVLDRADRGEELRVVCDQTGCPTYAVDLADATRRLLDTGVRGTVHFSNEGETTFFEYARFLLRSTGRQEGRMMAIRTSDLPRDRYPAPRPVYAVLSKKRYRDATGVAPRHWKDAVLAFLATRPKGGKSI